jgi:hypothetical protein
MGKLLLYRKKSMGKTGDVFADGQKVLAKQNIDDERKMYENEMIFF